MMRLMSSIILFVMMCTFAGCGSTPNNNPLIIDKGKEMKSANEPVGTGTKKIALVMKTLTNPFFIEMEKGARKAAKEVGVNLIVKTGSQETAITQQIEIIDELIRDQVDAIVIAPASSTEIIPVLKKAQDAKIIIINIDNQLDRDVCSKIGLVDVPFISVNNEQGAYLSAQYISEKINTPSEVVVLEGISEAKNSQDRKNGALRAFAENNNIKVVAVETANWKIDEAYTVASKVYKKFPDISAFFCANDMMALGVAQYLGEMGKKNVLVAGYDALDEAKEAVRGGRLSVTIDQQADVQGYLGVKFAMDKINAQTVPLEMLVDTKVIQRDNVK